MMKGWKTLAFGIAIAVSGVLQTFDWATVVPQDKTWSGVVMLTIGAVIMALRYVTTTPIGKSNPPPIVKALVAFIVVGFALSFAFPAFAQTKAAAAAPAGKLTAAQAQANPLAILQRLPITDLQAALADAQANNDATTIPCWQALLDAAQAQQAAPTLPAGIFSAIQKARDLKVAAANALSPTGPLAKLNIACAPLLMDVNNTLLMLGVSTGLVVGTGGISLPALPGLLPLLLAPKL